jgi:hypothetical protein
VNKRIRAKMAKQRRLARAAAAAGHYAHAEHYRAMTERIARTLAAYLGLPAQTLTMQGSGFAWVDPSKGAA